MKNSERNLSVIQNFILHVTHCSGGEDNFEENIELTPKQLYEMAIDYFEEDHVDGKGNPDDDKPEWFIAYKSQIVEEEGSVSIKQTYVDYYEIKENEQDAREAFKTFQNTESTYTAGYAKIIESTDHE